MRYLVTGITGFAAPHLARQLLREGHAVDAVVRGTNGRELDLLDFLTIDEIRNIRFHYLDLQQQHRVCDLFERHQFDGVFHLAAQSHPPSSFDDPIGTFGANVDATLYIVGAMQRYQPACPLMYCSTSEVYGNQCDNYQLLLETTPLAPVNPYGASKAAMDLYVQERSRGGFIRAFVVRPFSHTGARRGMRFSISWDAYHLALMKTRDTKDRKLPVGNLQARRAVLSVVDVVDAYLRLMVNHESGDVYNVCAPVDAVREMRFYTETLVQLSGLREVELVRSDALYRPVDIRVQVGDVTKLQRKTGWQPRLSIEETLRSVFDYWVRKLSHAAPS